MIIRIKRKMDLNDILIWSNLVIVISNLFAFCLIGSNSYINSFTILLSIILALQNYILLKVEIKNRNPFIILLVFIIIFFYLMRVSTLLVIPDIAYALNRGVFPKVNEINYTLIFIIISIIPLAWGLYTDPFNAKLMVKHKVSSVKPVKPIIIILLFTILILFSVISLYNINLINIMFGERVTSYLAFFLTNPVIILIIFTYFLSYYNNLSNKQRNIIIFLTIIYVVVRIISGSRSGIIQIILALIFSGLATKNYIELRRKLVLILLVIIIPSSFYVFGLATYIRAVQPLSVNYDQRIVTREGTLSAINDYFYINKNIAVGLGNVFERIGFLDMATEMISNKKTYEKMVNLEYYTKSTIDGLTPGFNVYNYPKVSNSLIYLYTNSNFSYVFGADRLSDFGGGYHSDQLTVFGEYYILFKGYFALIAFLFSGFCFRTIYVYISKNDSFNYSLIRCFLLYIFYNYWLNSFGIDWMVTTAVFDGIVLIACIILLNLSTKIKLGRIIKQAV